MSYASRMIDCGNSEEIVPKAYWKLMGGAPCSAYRFVSLAAPGVPLPSAHHIDLIFQGDDDFFSSDLPDKRVVEIWGNAAWHNIPLMLLFSSDDQYVPDFVDKVAMVQNWEKIYRLHINTDSAENSIFEILQHANHEIADERYFTAY